MSAEKRKVWVVGHKNPDTDSICAALSYAYLKNQTENDKTYVAKRAGAVNAETHYVLDYFGAQEQIREKSRFIWQDSIMIIRGKARRWDIIIRAANRKQTAEIH